jgi:hypothetical protein
MPRPLVSAVVAVYNLAPYVAEAIDSILVQKEGFGGSGPLDLEIVVVDDGSTDDLDAVIAPYKDKVTYLKKTNGGVASALNAGIRAARGKYVSTCDADDVQHPWRLPAQAAVLEKYTDVAQVFSDMQTWEDGVITIPSTLRDRPMGPYETPFDQAVDEAFRGNWIAAGEAGIPVPTELADRRLYRGRVPQLISVRHVAWTMASMLHREAMLALGGYDPSMRRWQDWYLSSLMSQSYEMAYLDVPVCLYRQHPNQLTKRPKLGAQMQQYVTDRVWRTDAAFRTKHPELFKELVHHAAIRLASAHIREKEWTDARPFLETAARARPARREAWTALARATVMETLGKLRR